MHEGAVCREIMDIVTKAAQINNIHQIYEITLSTGPYSCIHEGQLNFYFDILAKNTMMENAVIHIEKDENITGVSQMIVKAFKGE